MMKINSSFCPTDLRQTQTSNCRLYILSIFPLNPCDCWKKKQHLSIIHWFIFLWVSWFNPRYIQRKTNKINVIECHELNAIYKCHLQMPYKHNISMPCVATAAPFSMPRGPRQCRLQRSALLRMAWGVLRHPSGNNGDLTRKSFDEMREDIYNYISIPSMIYQHERGFHLPNILNMFF